MYPGNNQYQPNYQSNMQQPQQQTNYQEREPLKEASGTVISIQPHMDQSGQQKISKNGKAIWKIQLQTQYGQPTFWFFEGKQPAPQFNEAVTLHYSESPNPRGNGSPMKTCVFWRHSHEAGPQQSSQPFAPQVANNSVTSPTAVTPAPQPQPQTQMTMEQYLAQARTQGMTAEQALGSYILNYMQSTKTCQEFNRIWNAY